MKNEHTYQLLRSKMEDISSLPVQSFGPLTHLYKIFVPHFKYRPIVSIGLVSAVLVFCFYLIFGVALVRVATILQFGF